MKDDLKAYWDIRRRELEQQQQNKGITPQTNQSMNNTSNVTVDLREGFPFFSMINSEFTMESLAIPAGQINGPTSKNVYMIKEMSVHIVSQNQTVDLMKIDPSQKKTLILVKVPFVGSFLVPKEAVIFKDSINTTNVFNGKNILRG